jgi:hypothetical protein
MTGVGFVQPAFQFCSREKGPAHWRGVVRS